MNNILEEKKRTNTSDKLRDMKIGKLIAVMSLPAIFSMFIQALYNIVDSIYVSRLGANALNATSLVFPMQMILLAVAMGIGVGTNTLISRKLGERNKEVASNAAKHGVILALIASFIFIILGLTIVRPILSLMSNNDEVVTKLGTDYLTIIFCVSFGMITEICLSKILQSTGNMLIPMIAQLVGAITNIILDPIFIFNLGFGIKGAAIATVIGQILSCFVSLSSFIFRKQEVSINIFTIKYSKECLSNIFRIGLPVTFMNAISSITTTTINATLSTNITDINTSKAAINVIGTYFKLQSFIFMPVFGLTQGGMPILSYNYGANIKPRFKRALSLMIIISFTIMLIGTMIFHVFPEDLLSLFKPGETASLEDIAIYEIMLTIGVVALRRISLCFIFAAISIIFSIGFQAVNEGFKSFLMSSFRQLILLIPLAIILIKFVSLDAFWLCYFIAETITTFIFVPLAIKSINKAFDKKRIVCIE